MKHLIIIIMVLFLLSGCAAPAGTPEADERGAVEAAMPRTGDGTAVDKPGIAPDEMSKILSMIGNGNVTDARTYIDDKGYIDAFSQMQHDTLRNAVEDFLNAEYDRYFEQLDIVNNSIYFMIDHCADQFGFVMDEKFLRDFKARVDKRYDMREAARQTWLYEYFDSTIVPVMINELAHAPDFESVAAIMDAVEEEAALSDGQFANGQPYSSEAQTVIAERLAPYRDFTAEVRDMDAAAVADAYGRLMKTYADMDETFAQTVALVPYTSDCRVWIYSFEYDKALRLTSDYIRALGVGEDHMLHQLRELLRSASGTMDSCTILVDDAEGEKAVYHRKVMAISDKTSFVPYYNDEGFHAHIGLKADDWVFFDKVRITMGAGDDITLEFEGSGITRDVDHGFYEIADVAFSHLELEDITRMIEADDVTMRFTGERGKTYVHDLTSSERSAIKTLYSLAMDQHDLAAIFE